MHKRSDHGRDSEPEDEWHFTYVKVERELKYLYRAVDKEGNTIECMLNAKRDVSAAKRFFKKIMRADHRRLPFSISADKHASYPNAFACSQEERVLPKDCTLRRTKYLTNIVGAKRSCTVRVRTSVL